MTTYSAPLCMHCKHLDRSLDALALSCKAFPGGIPKPIYTSRVDHREPYPGDHGVQYEPDPAHPEPVVA